MSLYVEVILYKAACGVVRETELRGLLIRYRSKLKNKRYAQRCKVDRSGIKAN